MDNLQLKLLIGAEGGAATVAELLAVQKSIEKTAAESPGITRLAQTLGGSYTEAKKFADGLGLTAEQASTAIGQLRQLNSVGASTTTKFATLAASLGVSAEQFQALDKAAAGQKTSLGQAAAGAAELAFRFNNVVGALQNIVAAARPAYDLLIGSNEKLNAQLLSSQTNLANAVNIKQGGVEITDPTAKIKASEATLRQALKQIEIDTQSLVGVTSAQVNELFQITLTNAGALNNQSKQFPDAIAAATSLTKGWAASLKVVGIPLFQARQEINSIIKGQITQDSILAKNLAITNQQVETWRSQGRLVDELNKRLSTFVAGNAIAARSIEGISSNIQDLVERVGRIAGQPFLEPIINALANLEIYLKANETNIITFFGQLSSAAIGAGTTLAQAFAPLGKSLLDIGNDLGPIAFSAIQGLITILGGVAQVIAPIANLAAQVVGIVTDFAASGLGGIVIQTGLLTVALTQLTTIVAVAALNAFPVLATAAIGAVSSMSALGTGLVGVATGNAALIASSPAVVAALASITAVALPLAAALVPLTGAIGLGVLLDESAKLKEANDNLEVYSQQFLDTINGVAALSSEMKKLEAIRKGGGALTAEQIAREKQLQASAQAQTFAIQEQIKNLKALGELNTDQAKFRDGTIKGLEAQAAALDKAAGGLVLEGKEVEILGTTKEQFAKKEADLAAKIKSDAGGQSEDYKKAIKDQIALAKSRVDAKDITVEAARAQLEAIKSNTKADVDSQIAAKKEIDSLYDGRISKIKELIEVGQIQAGGGLDELAKIRDDQGLELSTRRKAAQQIVAVRREQIGAETAEIVAGEARIAAAKVQYRIGEARADAESNQLKIAQAQKAQEALQVAFANATSDTERQKINADLAKSFADQEKLQAEFTERLKKRQLEDFDERRVLLKVARDLGQSDQATYNAQVLANDEAQANLEIAQLTTNLAKLDKSDDEGRTAIAAKIATINSKKITAEKAYLESAIQLSNTYYQQLQTTIDLAYKQQLISDDVYASTKADNELAGIGAEIALQEQKRQRLGQADVEGRSAIDAKINELESKRIATFDNFYNAQLEIIKRAQTIANQLIQASETERQILIQTSANRQLSTIEQTEQAKLVATRKSTNDQLAAAQANEDKLASLVNITRSPEAERAYQSEVRSARLNTAQLTLKLLENEGAQIQFNRSQAIKSIEDQQAAQNRAAEQQLSNITTITGVQTRAARASEAAADNQARAIDRISKSLDIQNALYQAQIGLAKAIQGAGDTRGNVEAEKIKSAIELTKQLEAGNLSDRERIAIQQRLTALTGSNTQSIAQLTAKQQQIDQDNATRKQAALLFEQQQAREQLNLDQRKNDLANQRAIIEARIGELKAKQSLLDAQSNLQTSRINDQKTLQLAQAELAKASQSAPGRDRDRAVAEAQSKITLAEAAAKNNQANALQGIDLAKQQVGFATDTVNQAKLAANQQTEINRLQAEALTIQQQSAIQQAKATESARQFADQLERAKLASQGINVNAPTISQLPILPANITPPVLRAVGGAGSNGEVVGAINRLQLAIESRDPKFVQEIKFENAAPADLDEFYKSSRSAARIMAQGL